MGNWRVLLGGLALVVGACGHVPGVERDSPSNGVHAECNTVAARIQALYQIEKMMDDGDFSLATKAQLKEAAKLI